MSIDLANDAAPSAMPPVKVFILWTHVSGYMCENWRNLAAGSEIRIRGIAWETDIARDNAAFGPDVMRSLDIELVPPDTRNLSQLVRQRITDDAPDVIFVAGWGTRAYRQALLSVAKRNHCVIMGMDTPWLGRPKQYLTKHLLRPYLKNVDAVLVAGHRSAEYATRLGFQPCQIFRGLYSWDENLRLQCLRTSPGERRGFLFVGRYVPEKGLATLVEAYATYRTIVSDPWDLTCCGAGPLKPLLKGKPGIHDMGFIAPGNLPAFLAKASVFVLPSYFEPWGVAIAEAMGCSLPAIVSDACGASADLIEPGVSGFIVPTRSVKQLAAQMVECHRNPARLTEVAAEAERSASLFTSVQWAVRFRRMMSELLRDGQGTGPLVS